ncbi:MAG: endo-1,4-beta-xylanase [Deltaproteobacteria bacterium]|nr:endo-1,4-beta-xylanase [Deltaproteobacteria bacterium]MBN2671358.1 endo-1,4-beta-xylanase [Deltaproteobacteria bacterium]
MIRISITLLVLSFLTSACGDKSDAGDNTTDSENTGTDSNDTDSDSQTAQGTPLSAIPFDFLNCASSAETDATPPEGGIIVTDDDINAFGSGGESDATVTITEVSVTDQIFTSAVRIVVDGTPTNPWNVQAQTQNILPIANGDVLLAEIWARCEKTLAESNECKLEFIIEDSTTYAKVINYPITVGKDWRHVYVAVQSDADFDAQGAHVSLFAGYADQTVDVGYLSLLNYESAQTVDSLPKTAVSYPGIDADAEWRTTAAERIDTLRRGALNVSVIDNAGNPVPDANVRVAMTRHAFHFGSAISSGTITGIENQDEMPQYADEIVDLFNIVTPENAFKWKPWAGDWGSAWNIERAVDTLNWAVANDLAVRGHVMIWPGESHLPSSIIDIMDDPVALRAAIDAHIVEATEAGGEKMIHWDVVNEPFDNHDLMDVLGDEEIAVWFKRARELDSTAKLFLNDYAILSGGAGDTGHRDNLEYWIELLESNDAPLDGLGLQSHFGLSLTGPEDVYALLDRYGTAYNKEIAITEYDINVDDENLAGCFTHDFLTAIFSHEKVHTFVMWGFKGDDDPIYDANWNEKTAGTVYKQLVFDRWWTDEEIVTDSNGNAQTRAFYGEYDITATAGDQSVTISAHHLKNAPAEITIQLP